MKETLDPAPPNPSGDEDDMPRFFHKALFYDMDDDGLLDIVTVRSGFKVLPNPSGTPVVYPPFSELVYYKNPGGGLNPDIEWDEKVLYGGPSVGFMGPDIYLAMYDFEKDGIPEIVATHFFTGDISQPPTKGKIVMYGAPIGGTWSEVDGANQGAQPRVKTLNEDQGFPFSIEVIDLNKDGKMEILATNHQPNCTPYPVTPGRVYALEQPASGDVFGDDWTVRVLMDNIWPQPTPAGARGMRLAPGHAIPFYPKGRHERVGKRPWILVSGDEAGRVWVMKPKGEELGFETAVIFDINEYYGEDATQTLTSDGVTISTVGEPAVRYDVDCLEGSSDSSESSDSGNSRELHSFLRKAKNWCGITEIYIPIFEAKEIHVFSFAEADGETRITCPQDVTYECSP